MQKPQPLTEAEFAEKVSTDKIGAIDYLAVELYALKLELPKVAMEYYKLGGRYGKGEEFQAVQGRKAELEWKYEILTHTMSGLQRTLKAERIGVFDRSSVSVVYPAPNPPRDIYPV